MCGIVGYLAYDSVPKLKFFDILFTHAEKRGRNGVGVGIYKRQTEVFTTYKNTDSYSDCKTEVLEFIEENLEIGDLLLGICRNAPETEEITDNCDVLQPFILKDTMIVHNGAISESIVEKYKDKLKSGIDSECILHSFYENQKDIRKTFESLHGGWSCLLFDRRHKRLYAISSFIPMAHGYVRGLGLIYHNNIEAINETMAYWFDRPKLRFTRIWEDFYLDEVPNYIIEMTDIDSGLIDTIPYQHNFEHPTWKKENNGKKLYIVLASSGIDSTTSMLILKHFKKDVLALHFDYNHKSEEAERIAIRKITKHLDVPLKVIRLNEIYENCHSSMLIDKDIEVDTDKYIKSTRAWVPNRNGLMLNIAATLAEDYILNNEYEEVIITGGFPLISEESVYPDNSERFIQSFLNFLQTATLAGANGKIKYTNILKGLTKYEELMIMKYLGQEVLFEHTISCDDARVINGEIYQCWLGDSPACGSGRLSLWAAKKAGIEDKRKYYIKQRDREEETENIPKYLKNVKSMYGEEYARKLLEKIERELI